MPFLTNEISLSSILQISTADSGGGAQDSALSLFKVFRQRGYVSWMAVGRKESIDPDVYVIPNDQYRTAWVRFSRKVQARLSGAFPEYITRPIGWLAWLGEPKRLLDIQLGHEDFNYPGTHHILDLLPHPPSIIHCHNLHWNYFDLNALKWLSLQAPTILNLRDAWLLSGHCAHSFDCDRWKLGCGDCSDISIYPPIRRDATAYNWRKKRDIYTRSRLYVTTPSQWLMEKVHSSMLSGVRNRVIPNGIDLSIFYPGDQSKARANLTIPRDAKVILISAHNMFKDYDLTERALERIEKKDDSELLFICLGKEGMTRFLGQGRIVYPGFIQNIHTIADYYRASDVYLHAARDEAFGKMVSEAMASGTPVVATEVGGIPEQINHGETGFLVKPNDEKETSNVIEYLLANKGERDRMALTAYDYARNKFNLEQQADRFLDWYAEIFEDWYFWKQKELRP